MKAYIVTICSVAITACVTPNQPEPTSIDQPQYSAGEEVLPESAASEIVMPEPAEPVEHPDCRYETGDCTKLDSDKKEP